MQKNLFDSMFQIKKKRKQKTRVRSKLKPDIDRIFGIRFAEEVSEKDCRKCGMGRFAHPLVKTKDKNIGGYENTFRKLCIKDALKIGAPIKKYRGGYYDYIPEGYYKKLLGGK